jgi:DNA-binding MarR family transcriptional regulator
MRAVKTKLDSGFKAADESPGFLMWKAANLLQRSHSAGLKKIKMTPAQFSMMSCLVYLSQDGPVTSTLISRHSGMDKMMVSDLVKTLLRKRLIHTQPNPRDGRSFLIRPTEPGVRKTNSAVRQIEKIDDEFFKPLQNPRSLIAILGILVKAHSGTERNA